MFDEGEGAYDQINELSFGLMYHGITYADEAYSPETKEKMTSRFWYPCMKKGVIEFLRPEACPIQRPLREMEMKKFGVEEKNFVGLAEFGEVH